MGEVDALAGDCVEENETVGLHHRLALLVVAVLVLALLAVIPIAVSSNLQTLLRPTRATRFRLPPQPRPRRSSMRTSAWR